MESDEFGESGEFGETLSKGLTKANELAQTKGPVESGEFGKNGEFHYYQENVTGKAPCSPSAQVV